MVRKTKKSGKLLKVFLTLVTVAIVVTVVARSILCYIYPTDYSQYVEEYSAEYGVDKNLVYAVIKTESGFKKDSVSGDEARGLMQITPDTFIWISSKLNEKDYVHEDMNDPKLNIRYGVYLLSYLLDEFKDTKTALAAYHAGRGIVNKWLKNEEYCSDSKTFDKIPYADTAHYVSKVARYYKIYSRLYG